MLLVRRVAPLCAYRIDPSKRKKIFQPESKRLSRLAQTRNGFRRRSCYLIKYVPLIVRGFKFAFKVLNFCITRIFTVQRKFYLSSRFFCQIQYHLHSSSSVMHFSNHKQSNIAKEHSLPVVSNQLSSQWDLAL